MYSVLVHSSRSTCWPRRVQCWPWWVSLSIRSWSRVCYNRS